MKLYHGSDVIIEEIILDKSKPFKDFGKGFYVTTVKEQAIRWAYRKASVFDGAKPILNTYEQSDISAELATKTFPEDLVEWIHFVCACREESLEYTKYDIIMGKVANDKVFRVVDMYHSGIWDLDRALKEIKIYPTYDQIAFISQEAIDSVLKFKSSEEV